MESRESIKKLRQKKILIAAHRGYNGRNIPCYSIEGYIVAVKYGADAIEIDLTASKDGELRWGWFAEKGFEIIQSDWCTELCIYLKGTGYRI